MGLALLFAKSASAQPELAALKPPCRGSGQLEQDLRDCMADMRQNQLLFDMETEPELLLRYLKRIIKLNACSSRAPYRQERDRLEALLDRAAEINALPVADTVGEDRASRVWDVFDRLPLTPLERELFLFCYRDNRSPAEWSHPSSPGHDRPLSRTAIYGHLRKVITLIRETLAFEADES